MTRMLMLLPIAVFALATTAQAGNTSSNSSSNSSNGVHTRVDTIVRDDGRGRTFYERRVYRERQREGYRSMRPRQDHDDD